MAMKLPPKNYDNDLNRRKQGLDQIAKNEADIAALQALPVLPTPAAGDTGKIPKVNSEGGYELGEIPTELPTYSSADANKVLTVDNTGALEFDNVPNELPAYSSSDNGKVLAVDSNGELEFVGISSDIVVIRCTWNESSQIILPTGMTQNDLVALYKAGKIPILDCTSTTESSVLRLIMYMYRTTESSRKMVLEFSSFYYYSGIKIRTVSAKDENTYNYLTIESH